MVKSQTKPESSLFLLRGGSSAVPLRGVVIPSALWLCLFLELQRYKRSPATAKAVSELQEHGTSKWKCFRSSLLPLLVVFMVSCGKEHSFPWQAGGIWKYGPGVSAISLNLSFWVAEVVTDCTMDECNIEEQTNSTTWTTSFSVLTQVVLIVALTRKGSTFSHAVFWMKAFETLIATTAAKLLDNVYWILIGVLASSFLATFALSGNLAPLPDGVSSSSAWAYFVTTLSATMAYQFLQNIPRGEVLIKNINLMRSCFGCMVIFLFNVPSSWIIYDILNFSLFFGSKVVTDMVAISALERTTRK